MVRRAPAKIGDYTLLRDDGWRIRQDSTDERFRLKADKKLSVREVEPLFAEWVRSREAALPVIQSITIREILEGYKDHLEKQRKNVEILRHQIKPLIAFLGHLQPGDLDQPIDVEDENSVVLELTRCHAYAVHRAKNKIRRSTISTELNKLRSAVTWASKDKRLRQRFSERPTIFVPPPGRARETALTMDDALTLLGAIVEAPFHIRLFVLLALATAARKEAILDLTWNRVNFEKRFIDYRLPDDRTILDTSHQKGRAKVDMSEPLYDALMYAKEYATIDHVIEWHSKAVADVKKAVKKVFVKAGFTERFMGAHALRHTLATWAAEHDIDMRKIQKMLGHADIRTTEQVYAEYQRGYLLSVASVADAPLREAGKLLVHKDDKKHR